MKEIADPKLGDNYNPEEMKRIMAIASMCIHHTPSKRSFMNEVTVVSLRVSLDRVIWREIENPFYLVWI